MSEQDREPVTPEPEKAEPQIGAETISESVTAPPEDDVAKAPAGHSPATTGPARRGGGGMAILTLLLLGGAATAVAWYDPLNWRGTSGLSGEIAALTARLDASEAAAQTLEERLAQIEAAPAPVSADAIAMLEQAVKENQAAVQSLQQAPGVGEEVSAVQVAALAQTVDQLKQQLAGIASAPAGAGASPEAIKAAVDAAISQRDAELEASAKAAAEAAQQAAARADAVQRLRAAAQTGAPFADLLPGLEGLTIDPALQAAAQSGLVTQKALAEAFPEPARKALDASLRATGGDGLGDRFYTFLKIQTGARSLDPQEGSDPDAVLSRAEASVEAGKIEAALQELAALPPEGQAEMAGWSEMAQKYMAADKALNDLVAAAAVKGG